MNLASNSTIIAPLLAQGSTQAAMILVVGGIDTSTALTLDFGAGVTATVSGPLAEVTYAIPGNTYPSSNVAVPITLSVAQDATTGLRGCTARTAGQSTLIAFPAAVNIVAG